MFRKNLADMKSKDVTKERKSKPPMASLVEAWKACVLDVAKQGTWYTTGNTVPPLMKVSGKSLHFPLTPIVCEELMRDVSQPAPFGRGSETVVDHTVRVASQIDPACVEFDLSWKIVLDKLATELKRTYEVSDIKLTFYKLLLYGEGGHFHTHRDILRDKTHVSSLLISLPVDGGFDGGELEVRGPGALIGDKMTWPGQCEGISTSFCSFYTDCYHELKTVTKGYRVTLAYQVYSDSPLKNLAASEHQLALGQAQASALPLLQPATSQHLSSTDTSLTRIVDLALTLRPRVFVLLNHSYGKTVEPRHLKGCDRMVVEMMQHKYGLHRLKLAPFKYAWEDGEHVTRGSISMKPMRDMPRTHSLYDRKVPDEAIYEEYRYENPGAVVVDFFERLELSKKDPLTCQCSMLSGVNILPATNDDIYFFEEQSQYYRFQFSSEEELCCPDYRSALYFSDANKGYLFDSTDVMRCCPTAHIPASEYTGNEAAAAVNMYQLTLLCIHREGVEDDDDDGEGWSTVDDDEDDSTA